MGIENMFHQVFGQAKFAVAFLSSSELDALLNDDEKLDEHINKQLQILDQEKHTLIAQNRIIAEENVNKEPEIIERKTRISELSEQGKTICSTIQGKLTQLSE